MSNSLSSKSAQSRRKLDEQIRFDGRAIVITGAGRGMGREHALLLASRGASVVVADNGSAVDGASPSESPAQSVVEEIVAAGGIAVACTADLSKEEGSEAAVQASLDAFGRIDGLLHNASNSPDAFPPDQVATDQLELVQRINVLAAFWLTRAAWGHMREKKFGRIVYVSSHSIYGTLGLAPYSSAKSAFIGLTRSYALEGRSDNILCNMLLPSAYTRMLEKLPPSAYRDWTVDTLKPSKVSPGAAFLVSEACPYSGEMFSIGGGRIARVQICETEGVVGLDESIEGAKDAFEIVMGQHERMYPRDMQERFAPVVKALGFQQGLSGATYDFRDAS